MTFSFATFELDSMYTCCCWSLVFKWLISISKSWAYLAVIHRQRVNYFKKENSFLWVELSVLSGRTAFIRGTCGALETAQALKLPQPGFGFHFSSLLTVPQLPYQMRFLFWFERRMQDKQHKFWFETNLTSLWFLQNHGTSDVIE